MGFARANRRHAEHHAVERLGWLRAAVLGANDGILSTASLIVGVAAAAGTHASILIAGLSGLVAGAMSMAAGEYVSVSSQADSERADTARERQELKDDPASVVHHTDCCLFNVARARVTFSRISSAFAVQMIGFGSAL